MKEEIEDFRWVADLLKSMPDVKIDKKTFFEIAGFPRWENVMSNVLQFYFDKEEEHGLEELLLHSLLDCLVKRQLIERNEIEFYFSKYKVLREYQNIDLLISDCNNDWSIIVEHKVDHWLHNNLQKYWDIVTSKNKILIVLSTHSIKIPSEFDHLRCANITHAEFIANVERLLPNYWKHCNEKHLLFLKDFIFNLKKLDQTMDTDYKREKALIQLQESIESIKSLDAKRRDLRNYAVDHLDRALAEIGFYPYYNSKNRTTNHYYTIADFYEKKGLTVPLSFRFFIELEYFFEERILSCYFELHGHDSSYGPTLVEYMHKENLFTNGLMPSDGKKANHYYHLGAYPEFELGKDNLKNQLNRLFFEKFIGEKGDGLLIRLANQIEILKANDVVAVSETRVTT